MAMLGAAPAAIVRPASTGSETAAADPRLRQPTQGDLAGNRQFLEAALRTWRTGIAVSNNADRGLFDDLRGEAHVYWAGTTSGGPAAVVLQQAYLHPHGNLSADDANQVQTLVGLVAIDPSDGALRLVTDQYRPHGSPEPGCFQFGPGNRTILVVDRDRPLYFSPAPLTGTDGRVVRDWKRMPIVDGVATTQLPEGSAPGDARVLVRDSPPAPDDRSVDGLLYLEPVSDYLNAVDKIRRGEHISSSVSVDDRRLPWTKPEGPVLVGRSPQALPDWSATFNRALEEYGMVDLGANTAWGLWSVLAGLPDGRTAIVSEFLQGQHPSRLYAVLVNGTGKVLAVRAGDVVDPEAVLPVALHLPDAQGWVVAAYGAHLRYRTSTGGPWLDGGERAALLPDRATAVQVLRPGSAPAVVNLTP